jgi:hypothetical protein
VLNGFGASFMRVCRQYFDDYRLQPTAAVAAAAASAAAAAARRTPRVDVVNTEIKS